VREAPDWAPFPASAVIGFGNGTVRTAPGSPLFQILGGREEMDGPAILLRGTVDATFTVDRVSTGN
jgi:hypothetical protein